MYGLNFVMPVIALHVFVTDTGQPVISIFNGTRYRQSGRTRRYIFRFRSELRFEPRRKKSRYGRNTQVLRKRFFKKTGRAPFFPTVYAASRISTQEGTRVRARRILFVESAHNELENQ